MPGDHPDPWAVIQEGVENVVLENPPPTGIFMVISVVIPVYNEQGNLQPLHAELTAVLGQLTGVEYELIFVDDGSTDETALELMQLARHDRRVCVLQFGCNFGQTAAMQAGIEHSRGDVIVTIDADLQNDPADIPHMLTRLAEGYDLVHGWRKQRRDAKLLRVLPSRLANWLIARVTGVPVRDLGCTLKVMRRHVAEELELYGQMHRFIPILAARRGARCLEVVTRHRPRHRGQSKYGMARTPQVLLDLLTVRYMQRYFANPMRLFGNLALLCLALGLLALTATVTMKWGWQVDMSGNPLLLMGVFACLVSVQLLSLGLVGEVCARIYYDRRGLRPFAIANRQGSAPAPAPVPASSPHLPPGPAPASAKKQQAA